VTFAGHATSGDVVPLAVVADLVHLGAVSVWLGGLAMLTAVVLRGDADGDGIAEAGLAGGAMSRDELVGRFSPVAFGAVVAIVTSGVIQAWRQLGSWDALLDTNYGRLLLVKVSLVVAMLAAASVSRAWVRQRAAARAERLVLSPGPGATAASPDRRAPLSVLRRSVAVEAGLAVAVLAVTALLVNAVPGATASDSGSGGPFSATLPGENSAVQVVVDPAEVGPTQIHFYVTDPVGAPIVPEEVTASLSLPDRDIGRLDVPLVTITPDHFIADNAEFPFPGDWQLEILVRTSAFDQDRLVTELSVP
jgi:copper transport protein